MNISLLLAPPEMQGAVRAMPIRLETCGDVCQGNTYVGALIDVSNRAHDTWHGWHDWNYIVVSSGQREVVKTGQMPP